MIRHGLRSLAVLALLGLSVVTITGCGAAEAFGVGDAAEDAPADYSYVIPAGTGERIDAGEVVDILPARLDAKVGEVFELVNEDDRGHLIGPFYAEAGGSVRVTFKSPGEYQDVCTVHPSGQFLIVVS